MNENEYLILLKGKDKTVNVTDINHFGSLYKIKFSSPTYYTYSQSDVVIERITYSCNDCEKVLFLVNNNDSNANSVYLSQNYTKIKNSFGSIAYKSYDVKKFDCICEISDFSDKLIYINNYPAGKLKAMYYFGDFYRIIFDDNTRGLFPSLKVHIDEKSNGTVHLEYFKQLAGLQDDGKQGTPSGFLKKQYEGQMAINSSSILNSYINNIPPVQVVNDNVLIYPFYFNLSQKQATENAFANNISLIEGPPGTGKTQTILNIIANAVIQNKTVAIVSNNNAAIDNVLVKFREERYDFISAMLGNKDNKEEFFCQQPCYPENMDKWQMSEEEQIELLGEIKELQIEMMSLLESRNKQAHLRQELSSIKKEKEYFDDYYKRNDFEQIGKLSFYSLSENEIISFLIDFDLMVSKNKLGIILSKLKLFFKYGFSKFTELDRNGMDVIVQFQKLFYDTRINNLEKEIKGIEDYLSKMNFEQLNKSCFEKSKTMFKSKLYDRYKDTRLKRPKFQKNYLKDFHVFMKEYPVILSTTHAIRSSIVPNFMFDFLIIDEASQVDLVTAALALSCCRNAVIVGDLKQLPHIVESKLKSKFDEVFQDSKLSDVYNYNIHSILSSMQSLYSGSIVIKLLREHYRCHPKIIQYCNEKYYDSELITLTQEKDDDLPLILYFTAPGNHMRVVTRGTRGRHNIRELEVIVNEILLSGKLPNETRKFGFMTPYRMQVDKAEGLLDTNIEKDTVHKYQGRGKEVIIFSTVLDNSKYGKSNLNFVDDSKMVNVAVSRAKDQFVLVTNERLFKKHGTNIGDLIRYIEYNMNNESVIQSEIISVFDLLYSEYSEKLLEVKKKIKNISKYQSECLMNYILEKVLDDEAFNCFTYVHSVKLSQLINDMDKLDEDECKFAKHHNTSVDFVVYNKFDKKPVLVVEVDGFEFHANNPIQIARDNMKNGILRKYGIKVVRINTNESQEEEKLKNMLYEVVE